MTRREFAAVCALQDWRAMREGMVERQIRARGVKDEAVLDAVRRVPRHLFVPPDLVMDAYSDAPLPIGYGQTISQPYIVASMTEMLGVGPRDRVLEIGTGSGYQAAVLALLVKQVYSIEIVPALARQAAERLKKLGYGNVTVREGDGYKGWPEAAPFDRVILTAAPPDVPPALVSQLKPGGRLVAPVGAWSQELVIVEKDLRGRVTERASYGVRFVPMIPGKK